MERVNKILLNKDYIKHVKKIRKWETERIYCKHDMEHFLAVARIAYIMNLERNLNIDKELIYSAALLHDIGKWKQYKESTPHHVASVDLCKPILLDSGFDGQEIEWIEDAIYHHRKGKDGTVNSLTGILYEADKRSRNCFACGAADSCDWPHAQKNMQILY